MTVTETEEELSVETIVKMIEAAVVPREHRDEEFYAVAQLLEQGELTADEQKRIGSMCVKMIERDAWWAGAGGFRDE